MSLWEFARAWWKAPFFSWSIRIAWTGDKEPPFKMSATDLYPTPKDFVNAIRASAMAMENKYGIPWLFAVTQAAHESRYGNSRLSVEAFNLFGITGDSWKVQGKPVYEISTLEYDEKKHPYTVVRPFRRYASYDEALADWAALIIRRYPLCFQAACANDFNAFATALQAGGYATDPHYAKLLNDAHTVIEATV